MKEESHANHMSGCLSPHLVLSILNIYTILYNSGKLSVIFFRLSLDIFFTFLISVI